MESEVTFRNSSLPQNCFSMFADMRNQEQFCDIKLNLGTHHVFAHRVILAAAIPIFRQRFSDEEIAFPDIDPPVFESLVHYAYTCELKITTGNVKSLLLGSRAMGMKEVQDACCGFLAQRLQPQTALSFKELANDLNLPELNAYVDFYVKENFEEVCRTEEFLSFSFTYVRELIGMDDLNVHSEKTVLNCVLRWVKSSVDERKDYLPELLGQVRMVLLKPVYLTKLVESEDLIRKSYVIRDLVDRAKNYNLFPERQKKICSFPTKPRHFMNISEGISVTDTKLNRLKVDMKFTVLQLDLINQACSTKFIRDYQESSGSVATLDRKTYFFHYGYSFEYDPERNRGKILRPFTVPRKYTSAGSLRNKIYVCGGYTSGFVASDAVECFEPGKNQWTQVNRLQTARWRLNVVSIGPYIYALGGRDMHNVYGTVERYSFVTGKWQYMPAMLTPRHAAGSAILNGKIYVCGGYTSILEKECLALTEVYDPIKNKWKFISPMNTARRDPTLLTFSGKLYAVGGYGEDGKTLNSCEVLDLQSFKWKYGPTFPQVSCDASRIMVS